MGCGKTALLTAILGEMHSSGPAPTVAGSIAYTAQVFECLFVWRAVLCCVGLCWVCSLCVLCRGAGEGCAAVSVLHWLGRACARSAARHEGATPVHRLWGGWGACVPCTRSWAKALSCSFCHLWGACCLWPCWQGHAGRGVWIPCSCRTMVVHLASALPGGGFGPSSGTGLGCRV